MPRPTVDARLPRCRLLALLCAALVAQAQADGIDGGAGIDTGAVLTPVEALAASPETGEGEELFLEVVINQSPTGRIARFLHRDGRFLADANSLRQLGLAWPGSAQATGPVSLEQIPGIVVAYDTALQRLMLTVPLQALDRPIARIGTRDGGIVPAIDPAMRASGLLLNYDLYGQHQGDNDSLGATTELRLFGIGPGTWSNTLASRALRSPAGDSNGNVRLDTYWRIDWPQRALSLTVGDSTTAALGWSRATHIGGLRLGTDFSLQPYRITSPLATLVGEAALPSTVDLYINGMKQASQAVQPGVFQFQSVPSLNGVGQAQLVITDINGQSRVVGFDLYGTPRLLAKGLSEWSLELGAVRRDYGLRSFEYASDPMFSATARHGLGNAFTVESHAEASDGVSLAGAGATWLLGQRGGVASVAVSGSHGDAGNGHQHLLSYQWSSTTFNAYAGTTRASANYRDVASLQGSPLARRTDQAYLGTSTPLGQFGISHVRQDLPDAESSRYASLSWSRQLPRGGTLNLNFNRNLRDHGQDSAYLYWSMPLGRLRTVSASTRIERDYRDFTVEASQSAPSDQGGWGWRAQATTGDSSSGMAQLTRIGRAGEWTLGASQWDSGDTLAWASASGSLLWAGRRAHALRNVDDAFALVSTDGVPGVPVRLENRLVGVTDEDGQLLVTPLRAWQRNKLSIDPLDLPADLRIESTETEAVPAGHVGVKARFRLRHMRMLQFSVRDAAGNLLPAGTAVQVQGSDAATVVGQDGEVFLQDAPAEGVQLHFRNGALQCTLALPAAAPGSSGLNDLGTQTCR
ncbi:MAG: fimbria/pilus outer membrane usher protein [Pseudoxanthomonas sp.]